jgi:hypothetical protein
MLKLYDLGVAWEWEYDVDFVEMIERRCRDRNLTVYFITPENFEDAYNKIKRGELSFLVYFDRAFDVDDDFLELNLLLEKLGVRMINRYEYMLKASDKATMHLELLSSGVHLPYTLIIQPYDENPSVEIDENSLEVIGRPFIIKPSSETGGGMGVKIGNSIEDIIEARKEFPHDKYLVQEIIHPATLGDRKGWFRIFYILGEVLMCWWDNDLKVYQEVEEDEIERYELGEVEDLMGKIYSICKLDFFSSEIAITYRDGERKFVPVDYVNEMCDMRLKSKAFDGVPDEVIFKVADRIAEFIASLK